MLRQGKARGSLYGTHSGESPNGPKAGNRESALAYEFVMGAPSVYHPLVTWRCMDGGARAPHYVTVRWRSLFVKGFVRKYFVRNGVKTETKRIHDHAPTCKAGVPETPR